MLHELHTTMKTYQAYQAESRQAETKLRVAEQQRAKLEVANAPPEKLARSKKYKLIEKEVNKVREPATAAAPRRRGEGGAERQLRADLRARARVDLDSSARELPLRPLRL